MTTKKSVDFAYAMDQLKAIGLLAITFWEYFQEKRRIDDENSYMRLRRQRVASKQRLKSLLHNRRQRRLIFSKSLRSPLTWSYPRSDDWWTEIACNYTDDQWLQDFRLSRETFSYICVNIRGLMEKKDTNFRLCIPLKKRVAIALFKLASTAEYRLIGGLFGAVVDGKGRFWDVCVGSPGSTHDARVLRRSQFFVNATNGTLFPGKLRNIGGQDVGYYILGDAAYPLQSWLLKPYQDTGRLTAEKEQYNVTTSRARAIVEHSFGRLKGRWRCLLKRNDCDLELVKDMVETCCVLHNLCELNREEFSTDWNVHEHQVPPGVQPPAVVPGEEAQGRDARDALLRHFVTERL
ncbi:hypothetical protein AGOR_G00075640 [Albula goreensis]|uniref:DDE Tnp4 domain-containing protein n=1 Tax=Albula goreensis TaxID=1534307 RepID=A0A8T3DWU2_9TELE|nr:hypothetical protein AGOR_G00075640 [Albula goreensis]